MSRSRQIDRDPGDPDGVLHQSRQGDLVGKELRPFEGALHAQCQPLHIRAGGQRSHSAANLRVAQAQIRCNARCIIGG